MLLFVFFAGMLCVCFGVSLVLLRPTTAEGRMSLRLLAIRSVDARPAQKDEAALEESHRTARDRLEEKLLALPVGRSLRDLLVQSRSRRGLRSFLAISAALAVIAGAVVHVVAANTFAEAAAAGAGALAYGTVLRMRRARRVAKFAEQLPSTAAMMARALRAGHSVPQMLELAADQSKDPLREDFAQLSREQRLGVPLREALLAMSRRVPLPDLRFLVSAILIQKDTGGDLIQILERTAALIEERLRIRGQVRTFTAQGRMSAWVLTALPVCLLVLLCLFLPSYADTLFHDPAGQRMLMVGGALLLTGGLVIRRIVNIEV